jgi:hypothetical protein
MKRALLGALLGAGLVMAVGRSDQPREAFAQRAAPPYQSSGAGGEMIAVPTPLGDKGQVLTVIDPRQQTMGVYHVDLPSGKIKLLSVRNLRWDLQMTYLNNENPLPQEIRALLEQR